MKIKPCKTSDIPLLEKYLPAIKGKHQRRLDIQEMGKGLYLIAWDKNKPIGLIEIIYDGKGLDEATNFIDNCPDLKYLLVREEYRRKSVATELVREAIKKCSDKGFGKIGLLVDQSNTAARKLYENFEFKDSGLGEFPGINKSIVNGREVHKEEVANYWVARI